MKNEITERDPRAHAAAKADINIQLQKKVTELTQEAEQIDQDIRELEVEAARESDESKIVDLLAERSRLEQRKQAIPFILRGTQARALYAQAEALESEAADIKVDLDAAEGELEAATARVPELRRQLEEATEAVNQITVRRDALSHNYYSLSKAAGYAKADARCIERGEPMKFEPSRFIGVVPDN